MTIGVCVVASDLYKHHVAGWAESVAALTTQPDEILVVTESPVWTGLRDWSWLRLDVTNVEFGALWRQALRRMRTDWVVWIGADDRFRPTALDGIERDDADVVALGFQYDTGQTWMPHPTRERVLRVEANEVTCGSAFRRALFDDSLMSPEFGPLADWAFWVGLAAKGARFTSTGRIDVDYAFAGHVNPAAEPWRTQIHEWSRTVQEAS